MFLTDLHVVHVDAKTWRLTRPLVWEGGWEYFVIREGFETDFASIPKPARFLLDNAGRNSEAAVLHDAAWRESRRTRNPRVDPWHADGIFRRALRETGATTLSRGVMWFAVRAAATAAGRFGKLGPRWPVKLLQLLGMLTLVLAVVAGPVALALLGGALFWLAGWTVAVVWWLVTERRHAPREPTNWPWPAGPRSDETEPPSRELLLIIPNPSGGEPVMNRTERLRALLATGDPFTCDDLDLDPT